MVKPALFGKSSLQKKKKKKKTPTFFFICIEDGRSHNLYLDHYSADYKTQKPNERRKKGHVVPGESSCPAGQKVKQGHCHLENNDGDCSLPN